MKKLLVLPLFLLFINCYEQQRDCKDFRTGKFKFEYEFKGVKQTTLFERTEDLEIETYNGKTDTASVRWVNDCEYVLEKKHPKNREEKKAIDMKILSTSKNSYTFEFGIVGSEKKQKGTVTKLN